MKKLTHLQQVLKFKESSETSPSLPQSGGEGRGEEEASKRLAKGLVTCDIDESLSPIPRPARGSRGEGGDPRFLAGFANSMTGEQCPDRIGSLEIPAPAARPLDLLSSPH